VTSSVRVYISGPMSLGERAENVRRGIEAGDFFVDRGVAALVPHYSAHHQARPCEPGTGTYERVVASDQGWVEAADAVLLLPGESRGAERECDHARRVGVPVFTDREACLAYLLGLKALRVFVARFGAAREPAVAQGRRAPAPGSRGTRSSEHGVTVASGRRRRPTRRP
jgi:hypothetical protein